MGDRKKYFQILISGEQVDEDAGEYHDVGETVSAGKFSTREEMTESIKILEKMGLAFDMISVKDRDNAKG